MNNVLKPTFWIHIFISPCFINIKTIKWNNAIFSVAFAAVLGLNELRGRIAKAKRSSYAFNADLRSSRAPHCWQIESKLSTAFTGVGLVLSGVNSSQRYQCLQFRTLYWRIKTMISLIKHISWLLNLFEY